MSTTNLDLELIRIDGHTQPRLSISNETVAEYADEMKGGDKFPEVTVYFDGKDYWLADGFHRWHATRRAGQEKIRANVLRGTKDDARWHAVGANKAHGLRRTNADKARAAKLAIKHPKAKDKSLRDLAKHVGVSHEYIRKLQQRLSTVDSRRPKSSESKADEIDAIPMGEEPQMQNVREHGVKLMSGDDLATFKEAAKIVSEFRDKGFPGDRIELIAKTRPEPIRSAMLRILGADAAPASEPAVQPDADPDPEPEAPADQTGREIPAKLRPDFSRREEITKFMSLVSQLKSAVLGKRAANDPLYADLNPSQFKAECENVYRSLRALRPHAVCVYCAGDGCKACLNRGWLGEFSYAAAPEDMKHAG